MGLVCTLSTNQYTPPRINHIARHFKRTRNTPVQKDKVWQHRCYQWRYPSVHQCHHIVTQVPLPTSLAPPLDHTALRLAPTFQLLAAALCSKTNRTSSREKWDHPTISDGTLLCSGCNLISTHTGSTNSKQAQSMATIWCSATPICQERCKRLLVR